MHLLEWSMDAFMRCGDLYGAPREAAQAYANSKPREAVLEIMQVKN